MKSRRIIPSTAIQTPLCGSTIMTRGMPTKICPAHHAYPISCLQRNTTLPRAPHAVGEPIGNCIEGLPTVESVCQRGLVFGDQKYACRASESAQEHSHTTAQESEYSLLPRDNSKNLEDVSKSRSVQDCEAETKQCSRQPQQTPHGLGNRARSE